jgi:hypothetical protein
MASHELDPRPDTLKPISHVSPQTGGKGCSALLLADSDPVGSMQGKLVERVQIPVKHGAIGQSFPAFCRNSRSGLLTRNGFQSFYSSFELTHQCTKNCARLKMLSCADPENGMGQFVVRHPLHAVLSDVGVRCEARISFGPRNAIDRTIDLLIF